jgi:ATP-dependent Lon protease
MYRISTKGYDKADKNIIAKNYLLPNICKQINFMKDDIVFENDVIDYIVENFTESEDGVRNLKRCLEIIYTKLNLYRLMQEPCNIFKNDKPFKVELPFTVTCEIINKLIKKELVNDNWKQLYT